MAASEERMAEEGGGGHGDGGSCSAAGSAQRQPPPPPSQAPPPGSQAPAAPALAPDHLPQNNTLVALPIVAIENILSFMSYDEISQLRLVRPAGPRLLRGLFRGVRAGVWGGSPGAGRPGRGARRCRPKCPRCRAAAPLQGPLEDRGRAGGREGSAPRGSVSSPQPGTRPPAGDRSRSWAWCPPPG